MPEIVVLAFGAIAGQVLAAWFLLAQLERERSAHRAEVRDLMNRLQAQTLSDYQSLSAGQPAWVPPPEPDPRLWDETGLLSAPLEDTLND